MTAGHSSRTKNCPQMHTPGTMHSWKAELAHAAAMIGVSARRKAVLANRKEALRFSSVIIARGGNVLSGGSQPPICAAGAATAAELAGYSMSSFQ